VIYFSGFSLRGEEHLFADWLVESDYTAAGFSYGAIRALEYALEHPGRIDRLLLFSPAFFQTRSERFVALQLQAFRRDPESYLDRFLQQVASPAQIDLHPYLSPGSEKELEALLRYRWEVGKLRQIAERGTVIEVFIGEEDRIIDAAGALEFFTPLATATYRFRKAGHLLRK
jgi:pimeloyl-ACP methyl ester carboxylesterase